MSDSTTFFLTPSLSLNRKEFETTGHRFLCDDGESHATVFLGEGGSQLLVAVEPRGGRRVKSVELVVRTTNKERTPLNARLVTRPSQRVPRSVSPCFEVTDLPDIPELEQVAWGAVWSVTLQFA